MRYRVELLDPALSPYKYRGTVTLKDKLGSPKSSKVFANTHADLYRGLYRNACILLDLLNNQAPVTRNGGWLLPD